MTPAELIPYLESRSKWRVTEMQTMNERAGLICATIANVNRDPKKHAPYQPSDFVNCGEKEQPKKSTLQAIYDKMRLWSAALGGN